MHKRTLPNCGSSLLGMLLFLPLALFFLFVVIDGGLALTEKATILNAMRTAFNGENFTSKNDNPFQISDNGITLDRSKLSFVINNLAQDAANQIQAALQSQGIATLQNVKVTIIAIPLQVDPRTGVITDFSTYEKLSANAGDIQFNLTSSEPTFPFVSAQEYLDARLDRGDTNHPSPFALPAGFYYQPENPNSSTQIYLPFGVALYGEVTALTRGNNSPYVKQLLGRHFAVQEQQLRALRGGIQ